MKKDFTQDAWIWHSYLQYFFAFFFVPLWLKMYLFYNLKHPN